MEFLSNNNKVHFVLIPLLAQGHMIPMIDMASLLAGHGVRVSLVTTPQNTARISATIQRSKESHGLEIHLVEIPFPSEEVGLPKNCENLDSVPSRNLIRNFYAALDALRDPLEIYLSRQPPSCIISDKCLSWTADTARKYRVPRLVFHGMGSFSLLSSHNIMMHKPHLSVESDVEGSFVIPGLPVSVRIAKAQLPGAFATLPDLNDIRGQMHEAESSAYGVVINTFQELEHGFIEAYQKAVNKKVWCIGPVSLCNRDVVDMYQRGNKSSIDEKNCLEWLASMKPNSVLYACLGSQCRLIPSQLIEIALGLEASKHPFIWVIKTGDDKFSELEKWLCEIRYEERIRGRGLVIKGWAPQVLILSHPSVGGFLTHCGWNSTIEGVCSGVPMITWPMFAEQFLNEKLIMEVWRIGVRVGVEFPVRWGEEERVGVLVVKDDVANAVEKLMNGGEEGEERRNKAQQLGLLAKRAMDVGGPAHCNILDLIQNIMNQHVIRYKR